MAGRKGMAGHVSWNKGMKMSREFCEKTARGHLGQTPWNKGMVGKCPQLHRDNYHPSEEARLKMSIAHLGHKPTEETRQKISKYFKEHWKEIFGHINLKGEKNQNWRGGRCKQGDGYIRIYSPEHPHANKRGYVYEHRLIMESKLGRYLNKNEVVHHIDLNEANICPDNLTIMLQGHHAHYHEKLNNLFECWVGG